MAHKPIILVVLDGWGLSDSPRNITRQIPLPTFDILNTKYPMIALQASGISVGLPWGDPGNSEVGHMTMGAGRIMYQSLPRISLSIQNGSFTQNPAIKQTMQDVKDRGTTLHVMGLVGDGAVHSHRDHLYAIVRMAKEMELHEVCVHCFTDGRDSYQKAAGDHVIEHITEELQKIGIGLVVSVIGRNWAMDRNNNWDRIQKAYDMLVHGKGTITTDIIKSIKQSYDAGITDEFIEPHCLSDDGKTARATIKEGDGLVFFNFRDDRARQITKAFSIPEFDKFPRDNHPSISFTTMMEYEKGLPVRIAFPPEEIHNSLGEVLSKKNLTQLRIAETEKYAHITYFFNCGAEEPFANEIHKLVPSPAVDRFDQKPEMSAFEITDTLIAENEANDYDFILVNYANADMVAHTGNIEASKKACIALDQCLNKLIKYILSKGGQLFITADHGNIEIMQDPQTGAINTKHDPSPIPLWHVTPTNHRTKTEEEIIDQEKSIQGLLSDVAPTILTTLGIEKPSDMQGVSLLDVL